MIFLILTFKGTGLGSTEVPKFIYFFFIFIFFLAVPQGIWYPGSPVRSESYSVVSDYLRLHELYSPWNSPGQNTEVGSCFLLQGIFSIVIEPRAPALQEDSLPAEPPGNSKNIGVGSLSLLQRIFPTQELNQVSCIAGRFFTS